MSITELGLKPSDGFRDAVSKNPHLKRYIDGIIQQVGEPIYIEQLSRDLRKLREINIIYPVSDPIFIHIYTLENVERAIYRPIEPEIPEKLYELRDIVEDAIGLVIDETYDFRNVEQQRELLFRAIDEVIRIDEAISSISDYRVDDRGDKIYIYVNREGYNTIKYTLEKEKIGLGALEPLIRDPYIEDITCGGIGPIFIEHKVFGSCRTTLEFMDDDELNDYIIRLSERIGKPASYRKPIIDGTLPDNSRINIVYGRDVSINGSNFTIRKFTARPLSIIQLCLWNTLDYLEAAYIWLLLENNLSLWVCGETASGKTTTLKAIAAFIRPNAKIVSIEDTPEVVCPHENWTRETTREGEEEATSVQMFDLLKAALRQRPNYIIVGEIRGAEGSVAFQAMQSVSWDTPIMIRDADTGIEKMVRIGEFIDRFYRGNEENIPKYIDGYEVLSMDKSGRVRWSKIRYILRHKASEIYEIEYGDGGVIKTTGSHSVFILDKDNLIIRPLPVSRLREGDILISFIKYRDKIGLKTTPDTVEDDHLYIDGLGLDTSIECYKHEAMDLSGIDSLWETLHPLMDEVEAPNMNTFSIHLMGIRGSSISYYYNHSLNTSYRPISGGILETYLVKNNYPTSIRVRDTTPEVRIFRTNNELVASSIAWKSRIEGSRSALKHSGGIFEIHVLKDTNGPSGSIPLKPLIKIIKNRIRKGIRGELGRIIREYSGGAIDSAPRDIIEKLIGFIEKHINRLDEEEASIIRRYRMLMDSDVSLLRVYRVRRRPYNGYVYDISVPETELFIGGCIPVALHNTGHPVMATFHAASVEKLIQRLTGSPINIPKTFIDNLNAVIIQSAVRLPQTGMVERRAISLNEIVGYDPLENRFNYIEIFSWDPAMDRHIFRGEGMSFLLEEKIAVMKGLSLREKRLIYDELYLRRDILRTMAEKKIIDYYEVWEWLKLIDKIGLEEGYRRLRRL